MTTDGTSFTPVSLGAEVGVDITFTNSGGTHSVTPDDTSAWPGATVDEWGTSGATYTVKFAEPGTYPYHCSIHGGAGGKGMSGTITVS